jgi:hypothetical protein
LVLGSEIQIDGNFGGEEMYNKTQIERREKREKTEETEREREREREREIGAGRRRKAAMAMEAPTLRNQN